MDASVSETIDQKTYLKKFKGLQPLQTPSDHHLLLAYHLEDLCVDQ